MNDEKTTSEATTARTGRRTFLKCGLTAAAGIALSPLVRTSRAGAAGVIRIGFPSSLTGPFSPWILRAKKAVDLITEEVNAAGGIKSMGGSKLEILYADTQSNLSVHQREVEKMITVNKAMFLISGASALEMVGSAVSEKHGAIMIGFGVSDELTSRGYKGYFRAVERASDNARGCVDFVWHMQKEAGKKFQRVAVLHSDDSYGALTGRVMEAEILKRPEWKLTERIAYSPKLVDATDHVSRLKGQEVEVLFEAAVLDAGIVVRRAMKTVDFNPQADIHSHGAASVPAFLETLGKDADYVYYGSGFASSMIPKLPKNIQDFNARFKQRYGDNLDHNAMLGTTILGIFIEGFERAKSAEPGKVREAIEKLDLKIGDSPYILSDVKFDSAHNNLGVGTRIHQARDKEFRTVWPDRFKIAEAVWPAPRWKERA
jgi:branched-chain amino acid transport system substrate-binding protein